VTEAVHRCTKKLTFKYEIVITWCACFSYKQDLCAENTFKNVPYDNYPAQAWLWKLHVDKSSFDTHNTSTGNYLGKRVAYHHPHHLSTILPDPPLSVMRTVTLHHRYLHTSHCLIV